MRVQNTANMTSRSRSLLLLFSALGLGAAATSTYVHYRLLTDPVYTSFCDVSASVSCSEAYVSHYGSLWGVPVAPLGVLFFVFVMLVAGVAGGKTAQAAETAPAYIFTVSTIALALVLYLGYASYFTLKVFCMMCAATYVAVIAIFIISGAATTLPMTTLPNRATKDLRTLVSNPLPLLLTLVFVGGAAGVLTAFPRDNVESEEVEGAAQTPAPLPPVSEAERAKLAEWWDLQPKVTVPVPDDGKPVVIVKFNDYQCPACKVTHDAYKPVIGNYVQLRRIKYVVKHFPLEGECNPAAAGGNHYAACEAAAAVIMARANGVGASMEDWFFANIGPPALTPEQVKAAARKFGGILDFDVQYPKVLEEVKADSGLGKLLNVDSTPTFFINGRRLPKTLLQPQYLDALIQLELKRAEESKAAISK
jgi:uncharacterized membrane protein/protein-disulfide isomerase